VAKATLYDPYEDVGLAFTEDEVAGWSVTEFANDRVDTLLREALGWRKRASIPDMDKAGFSEGVASRLVNTATWYCKAIGLDGVDRSGLVLPSAQSKEGKALAKWAQDVDPAEWVAQFLGEAQRNMTHVVTIGRRQTGWQKAQHRLSNKLANCVMKEVHLGELLEQQLGSMPS
jgi:hypothetical protein